MNDEADVLRILSLLAEQRKELARAREEQRAYVEKMESSDYYQGISTLIDTVRGKVEYLEGILRNATLASFAADGNKKPFPACGVRVIKVIESDEKAALEYCLANFHGALQVNHKLLDPVAIANKLPFIIVTEVPTATIASDLSAYLPKGEDA